MSKTILLVDDEPVVVEIARKKLQERGYEILVAHDGEEALAQLKVKLPHLIVLDVQMPKMNGYSFMMEKNKVPEFAEIPVIVLTANSDVQPIFKRHRIKAYLLKPLKLQDLLNKVEEILPPQPTS